MPFCNSTDGERYETEKIAGPFTVHQIGFIICAVFAVSTTSIAAYLMQRHASNYTRPAEQRHVLRIIFMLPVYAIITTFSYGWYWYAIYFEVIRDCYEAFALASFFFLMTFYLAPSLREQKQFFRRWAPKPWPWPATWLQKIHIPFRTPRSGLTWFNIIWIGVFQYCFIRVASTFVTLITQWYGVYCEDSWNVGFAHVWIIAVVIVMISIALYVLVAFYSALKTELGAYRPFLKFLSIKLVIFFSFWQAIVIGFLVSRHFLKPTKYISEGDLSTGINAVLISVEMTGFAVMHLYSYPWKDYTPEGLATRYQRLGIGKDNLDVSTKGGLFGWKAYVDTFNPWDMIKAFARGMRWLFVGRKRRHSDSIYSMDDEVKFKSSSDDDDDDDDDDKEKLLPTHGSMQSHNDTPVQSVDPLPLYQQDTSYPRAPESAAYDSRPAGYGK